MITTPVRCLITISFGMKFQDYRLNDNWIQNVFKVWLFSLNNTFFVNCLNFHFTGPAERFLSHQNFTLIHLLKPPATAILKLMKIIKFLKITGTSPGSPPSSAGPDICLWTGWEMTSWSQKFFRDSVGEHNKTEDPSVPYAAICWSKGKLTNRVSLITQEIWKVGRIPRNPKKP